MSKAITLQVNDCRYFIFGVTENIIRCVCTKKESPDPASPLGICLPEQGARLETEELENGLEISTERLTLWIDREDGRFVWTRKEDGSILLEEGGKELTETAVMKYTTGGEKPVIRRVKTVDGERNFIDNMREVEDRKAYRAKLAFCWRPGEQIHGLGQGEEGIWNLRGHVQYLYQHNMRIPVPFLVSDQGYGILADCGSLMTFNDDERGSYLYFDTVEQLDYYFIYGEDTDEIIDGFRQLTGRAAMLPKWAFGYIQSKEKYSSQEELVGIVKRYRELGVGLDCVVQDWKTWPADDWGCKTLDKERYPDLKAAMDEIHGMNVHSMVSVWPNMNYGTRDYNEMSDAGYLLNDLATYDAFEPKARELYWKQCERELFAGGFDSWWCDSTEPFSGPDWNGEHMREPWERYNLVGGEHRKFLGAERANLYALAHAQGIFENQRKAAPDRRVLNLTRSGYAGSQKYGTMLWSGDISARWDVMKKQIVEGLNISVSGMPYWTLDIGGFFVVHENWQGRGCECDKDPSMKWFWHGGYEEGIRDPGFRELYVRWFEFGSFLPMFRSHGTDAPREIWNFGEPGGMFYDALAETVRNRYRLMPYIYSMAGKVVRKNGTMIRSLLFDFPEDRRAASLDSEYMFGDSLLVCPVTEPMYYEREGVELKVPKTWNVYLPAGCGWYDFYTGEYYEGGQELAADAPIDRIPVFVRAGSILPMEEGLAYAQERPDTPFEIRIYPEAAQGGGKTAAALYYEDDGETYDYEKGIFNEIPIVFDGRSAVIGKSRHGIPGGLSGRKIRVIFGNGEEKTVLYTGEEISVPMN